MTEQNEKGSSTISRQGISGNWVAIVTIVVSAVVNIFSIMYGMRAEAELEKIKIEGSFKQSEAQHNREVRDNLCKAYSSVASRIARASAAINREYDLNQDSELEAAIWEGIVLLQEDSQNTTLKQFVTPPAKEDEYGLAHRDKLTNLTLLFLAAEARQCFPENRHQP
ncbi:ABC-type lipoprotein release transport system permease subunit [Rheinheimera pacifica]|uniref:hypothetical protein n=1 Tax=Rheinheimera pacifica TaxID=173990 RepID=UPI002168E01D|nr:hypothetical protein [Rheinheimera pacifica]MCS4309707.1 ABC-type lipoprotein release transport system permease subunit [Rheinheimera pacifica]